MKERVFTKKEWDKALRELSKSQKIFVPAKEKNFHNFTVLDDSVEPDFDFQNTRLSPKSVVFPQSERMFEYTLDENSPDAHILKEAPKDFPPQAIIGIRPCDAHAFQIVNVNFDNPEYRDPWWVQRYKATTFVGLGCNEPCSTCFCTSVGGGPFSEKGLDVLLHDLGDEFLARAVTEKGAEFLDRIGAGKDAGKETSKKAALEADAAVNRISSSVATERLKEKTEIELFDAPFWEKIAFPCINCGTCTYLCPTCWCFDIQDEVFKKEGDRIRNWDSCMFPLFTLHGSGHNPREKKVQRVRQRFMHKLKYYVDKYGNGVACVGCGRCVQLCPVNIDIREVFELMNSC